MADGKPANFGNSTDWWTTTKAPLDLFRPAYQNGDNDEFIRETVGVDPLMIASDLKISAACVEAYQRRLGVRARSGNKSRKAKLEKD